jgi:hypothetical protein
MSGTVFPNGPLFPPLGASAHEPHETCFVVRRRLDQAAAEKIARREIFHRWLAPADIGKARATALDRTHFLQMPFWRVGLSIDGFHVNLNGVRVGRGPIGIPIPMMQSKHRSGAIMVSARSAFPYEIKVPSWIARSLFGVPPLEVGAEDLLPQSATSACEESEGEMVECDVPREVAEQAAQRALLNAVEPSSAIYSKYEPRVQSVALVRYPIYYVRYRYDGEARQQVSEDCAVAVSARTGKLVTVRHPSGARAIAGKLKRLFSLS